MDREKNPLFVAVAALFGFGGVGAIGAATHAVSVTGHLADGVRTASSLAHLAEASRATRALEELSSISSGALRDSAGWRASGEAAETSRVGRGWDELSSVSGARDGDGAFSGGGAATAENSPFQVDQWLARLPPSKGAQTDDLSPGGAYRDETELSVAARSNDDTLGRALNDLSRELGVHPEEWPKNIVEECLQGCVPDAPSDDDKQPASDEVLSLIEAYKRERTGSEW